MLLGRFGEHLEGEVVDLDGVLRRYLAVPVQALHACRALARGCPGDFEGIGHPIDALRTLHGHGVQQLRVNRHLLQVVHVSDHFVRVVGVAVVGPLHLVGHAVPAEVHEHAAVRRGAAGLLVLLQHDDLVARVRQAYRAGDAAAARSHDHDVGLEVPRCRRLDGLDGRRSCFERRCGLVARALLRRGVRRRACGERAARGRGDARRGGRLEEAAAAKRVLSGGLGVFRRSSLRFVFHGSLLLVGTIPSSGCPHCRCAVPVTSGGKTARRNDVARGARKFGGA